MKTDQNLRSAFSMLTSLVIIVLMASVAIFVMNLSGKVVKSTTTQYQHEQAELYAKSYTEYAILAITGNNRSNDCLENIDGNIGDPSNGNGYRIRVRLAYITSNSVDVSQCSSTRVLNSTVTTSKTPLSVIIDAYVDYKDPEHTDGPWMTVHRRTIQKI